MRAMLQLLNKFDQWLIKFVRPLLVVIGLFVPIVMVTGILMRSAFNAPLLGLEEIILFCVMWLYMLGAVLASRDRSHLSADFVSAFIHNVRIKNALQMTAKLVSMVAVVAFVVWSFDLLHWGLTMQQSTPVFRLPLYLSQASVFVASLCFLLYQLRDLISDLVDHSEKSAEIG